MSRIVILNAFSPTMLDWEISERYIVEFIKSSLRSVKATIQYFEEYKVVSYVRHPALVNLLNEKLGLKLEPSAGLYKYDEEDKVFVIVLKKPVRGQEVVKLSEGDIDVFRVYVYR